MFQLVTFFAAAAVCAAAVPSVEGRWTGRIQPGGSSPADMVVLTVHQMGAHLSGSLTFMHDRRSMPFAADLEGDEFTLQVLDQSGNTSAFRLKVSDTGISGEATSGGTVSKLILPISQQTAIPVGGVGPPVLIHKVEPQFTEEARQAKLQGTVVLALVIDETGKPTGMTVRKSLGMGLDQKAMECVEHWKFQPATGLDGKPKATEVTVEVNFRIPL
jgi:TonB family protein